MNKEREKERDNEREKEKEIPLNFFLSSRFLRFFSSFSILLEFICIDCLLS